MHVSCNPESGCEHFQFRLKRSLARDKKFSMWMVFLENRERAEARSHTFLRDQTAGLDHSPAAIWRRLSFDEWESIQWNASAVDAQLVRRTAKLNQTIG